MRQNCPLLKGYKAEADHLKMPKDESHKNNHHHHHHHQHHTEHIHVNHHEFEHVDWNIVYQYMPIQSEVFTAAFEKERPSLGGEGKLCLSS